MGGDDADAEVEAAAKDAADAGAVANAATGAAPVGTLMFPVMAIALAVGVRLAADDAIEADAKPTAADDQDAEV